VLVEVSDLVRLRFEDIADPAVLQGAACAALCMVLVSFAMQGKAMSKDAVLAAVGATIDRYIEHRMKEAS
jgi:hypothetical protein